MQDVRAAQGIKDVQHTQFSSREEHFHGRCGRVSRRASGTGATPAHTATLAPPSPATRRSQHACAANPCRSCSSSTRMVWRRNQPTEAAYSWVQEAARRTLQGGARVEAVTAAAGERGWQGFQLRILTHLSPNSSLSAIRRCVSSGRPRMPVAGCGSQAGLWLLARGGRLGTAV